MWSRPVTDVREQEKIRGPASGSGFETEQPTLAGPWPSAFSLDGGGLDDGLALFLDRLVGAEDGLPDDRAEDAAEEGADPEHPG